MTVIYCATQLTLQLTTEAIDSKKQQTKQTLNIKHKLAIGQWTTSHLKQTFVGSVVTTRSTFGTTWYQVLRWYSLFYVLIYLFILKTLISLVSGIHVDTSWCQVLHWQFFFLKTLISLLSGIHIVVVLLWWTFVFHLPKTNMAAQVSRNNRQGSHNTIMQAWLLDAPKKTK